MSDEDNDLSLAILKALVPRVSDEVFGAALFEALDKCGIDYHEFKDVVRRIRDEKLANKIRLVWSKDHE